MRALFKRSLLAAAIAVSVAACGGGSSSGGGGADTPESTANATLSGTAAKGIIQAGIVTAVELNSDGSDHAEVGTAITDAKGRYELTLGDNYTGGVVRLRISADAATKMKCDAFDGCGDGKAFGSSVDLSAGFSLDAIVQPTSSTVKVQITPLTHMAAARAVASGAVSAETVANAISEVNSIVGVNIMENEVVDITDAASLSDASPEAKQLALFNAGLAEVLVSGDGDLQANLEENLQDLAESFEDGQFDSTDAVTITEITTAVKEAVTDVATVAPEVAAELEEAIDTVSTVAEVIESQTDESGEYNPEPSTGANLDDVAKAKALLTNARTFIEQIGTNFEEPLDALDIEATTAADILSDDTAAMSQLLTDVIDQVIDGLDENVDFDLETELSSPSVDGYSIGIVDDSFASLGTVTAKFTSTASGVSVTLNGALTGDVELVSRTVNINNVIIATNLTEDQIDFDEIGVLTQLTSVSSAQLTVNGAAVATGLDGTPDTSITLDSVVLGVTFATAQTIDTSDTISDVDSDAQDDALEAALTAASFDGNMTIKANGSTFTGDVEIKLVDIAVASESPLSLQKIAVNGSFSGSKGSFTAGATLTVDNATSFDTFGFIDYDEKLHVYDKYDYYIPLEDRNGQAAIDQALVDNPGSYLIAYHSLYNSSVGSTARIELNTGTIYTPLTAGVNIVAEGIIKDQITEQVGVSPDSINVTDGVYYHDENYHNESGYFYAHVYATFPDFETVDNFVKGTITLTTSATVPELPAATVTASVSRTNIAGGNANITVSYGGQSFMLDAVADDLDAAAPEGTLTLTNPDGVKMVLNLKETEKGDTTLLGGTVSVGGTQVGEVSETDNGLILVRYNDGSFESLF